MIDASGGVDRFCSYLERISTLTSPDELDRYPGLEARSFHDPQLFEIVSTLEKLFPDLQEELVKVAQSSYQPEIEDLGRTGSWDILHLFERGRRNEVNCALCPLTAQVLDSEHIVKSQAGLTYLSRLSPGTRIAPHCGPNNLRLRCHLGITVPQGDCALRVGSEVQKWREGKALIFDDSLEHEAWNLTNSHRIVLIIDIWHPDLSTQEIELLRGLHTYSAIQAERLARYWLANDRARTKSKIRAYLQDMER